MELTKSDLKKSFYGLVPTDWITCQFQEVLTGFSSGMTPYRAIPEYYKGNIPWITSGELNYNVITDTIEKITQEAVVKTNLKILPKGTFLMAITGLEAAGTRGSCAITGVEATTNQSCMALFPKEGKIETNYLYHFYVMYGNDLAFKFCQGSKQQSYTGRIVKILPINLPPTLKEQKAIATALSDVDDLIVSLEGLIAKKQAIKQGAMQQLLTPPHKGGKRLSGFSGDWVEKNLGELAWFQEGPGLRKWQFTTKGIKVINITNLVNGYLDLGKTTRHISWDEFNKMYKHFEVDEHDIVVASSGNSYCKTSVVRQQDLPLVMNTSVIRFKPNSIMDYQLLLVLLKSSQFKKQIDLLITGGAQPNFGPVHLPKVFFNIPESKDEQKAIAKILSDMDTELEQLETKKAKYQQLKQGMLQELLTGNTRLV
ncbi:restriction endonuclease subunit S [Tenacibaculum maritimum]|uniref:restriction endonuclease subunit S n=1 Tax=Tenacibaculum maritimum TaxID=107401 RepID=UPI003875F82C